MEELIMKIIDIEERAQEVIKDAKKADEELPERIDSECRKLEQDIAGKVKAKNAALRQLENEDADKRIKKIEADTEKRLSELDEKYNKSKEQWVNGIVNNIIGG